MAVPVRDEMGAVVAALSLSVPVNRFRAREASLLRSARDAAAEIQRRIVREADRPQAPVTGTPDVTELTPASSA